MKKAMKFIVSVLLCGTMMLSNISFSSATTVLATDTKTPSAGCVLVGIEGRYLTDATAALKRINEIRYEACKEGVINSYTGRALTLDDYVEIKWSSAMEIVARIRAAEATVVLKHIRPNGKDCFSASTVNGDRSYGEVLAWNASESMVYAVNQWYSEKADWVNGNTDAMTGHYTIMITPEYKYVGLSLFDLKQEGWNTTAGEFSYSDNLSEMRGLATSNVIQTVELPKSFLNTPSIAGPKAMTSGQSAKLQMEATADAYGNKKQVVLLGKTTWSSSNGSIVSVAADGTMKALKVGQATITAKNELGYTATMNVQVSAVSTAKPSQPTTLKKPTISKLQAKKKALVIKWKKDTKASGYQIQVATNKKFTKSKKTAKIKKNSVTKTTMKSLKKKKKYFVRVRSYLKKNGVTTYSEWSKVKSKKTK